MPAKPSSRELKSSAEVLASKYFQRNEINNQESLHVLTLIALQKPRREEAEQGKLWGCLWNHSAIIQTFKESQSREEKMEVQDGSKTKAEKKHIYGLQMRNVTQLWLFFVIIKKMGRSAREDGKLRQEVGQIMTAGPMRGWAKGSVIWTLQIRLRLCNFWPNPSHSQGPEQSLMWSKRRSKKIEACRTFHLAASMLTFCRSKSLIYGTCCPDCRTIYSPVEEEHDEHRDVKAPKSTVDDVPGVISELASPGTFYVSRCRHGGGD